MALLEVVEDEPRAKRLVLRARPWSMVDRARRLLATLASTTATFLWVPALFFSSRTDWALVAGVAFVGFGLAFWLSTLPPEEVEEIRVEGVPRLLSIRLRGRWIWRRHTHWWTEGSALRVASLGLSPAGPSRAELGIELALEHRGRRQLLAVTGVRGLDRRDELEALVHVVADALGQRVAITHDSLLLRGWEIGPEGEPPRPRTTPHAFGYREAPAPAAPIDLGREAGFEGPAGEPSTSPTAETELRSAVVREGERVVVRGERPVGLAVGVVLTAIVTGVVGARGAGDAWGLGASVGAAVPFVIVLSLFGLGPFVRAAVLLPGRVILWLLGRDFPVLPRSPAFALGAGFVLDAEGLRVGPFGRRVGRTPGSSLFLVDRHESWKPKGGTRRHRAWRELWLHEGGRWRLLVRSRVVPRRYAGPTRSLFALTHALGSRLNLPVRFAMG